MTDFSISAKYIRCPECGQEEITLINWRDDDVFHCENCHAELKYEVLIRKVDE